MNIRQILAEFKSNPSSVSESKLLMLKTLFLHRSKVFEPDSGYVLLLEASILHIGGVLVKTERESVKLRRIKEKCSSKYQRLFSHMKNLETKLST